MGNFHDEYDGNDKFEEINAVALGQFESLVRQWLPGGKMEGHNYVVLNPTRNDKKSGSFKIDMRSGGYHDFANEDHGNDPVATFAYLFHGNKQGAAAKELAEILNVGAINVKPAPENKKTAAWVAIVPPLDVTAPPKAHPFRGLPEAVWCYRSEKGATLGYVYRFKTSDGGKETIPLTWCRNSQTGFEKWRWKWFEVLRPLYGLERLAAKPDANVLVVEGEKCADVAEQHLRGLVCLTWPAGSKAVDKANWEPLVGRKVIVWPDCDAQVNKDGVLLPENEQPGCAAANKIAAKLVAMGCKVWMMNIPKPGTKKSGWDVADAVEEGLTGEDLSKYVNENLRDIITVDDTDASMVQPKRKVRRKNTKESGWDVADAVEEGLTGEDLSKYVNENLRDIITVDDTDASMVQPKRKVRRKNTKESDLEPSGETDHGIFNVPPFSVYAEDLARLPPVKAVRPREELEQLIDDNGGANERSAKYTRPKQGADEDWECKLLRHVRHWNKTHASVVIGGKHRIMRVVAVEDSPELRSGYEFFSRSDLSLLHDYKVIQTGFDRYGAPAYKNHLMAWAKHSQARTYVGGVVFLPGRRASKSCFNTWQGFAVEPKQNDAILKRIYAHISDVICGGQAEMNAYVLNWIARTFQFPDRPAGSALVMRGEKGTGKGMIGHFLRALWGRSRSTYQRPQALGRLF